MKKIFFLLVLTLVFIGCKGEPQISYKNDTNKDIIIPNSDTIQGIKILKEFYFKFYGNDTISNSNNEKLKRKFLSQRIISKIDSLTNGDDLILDYDPFIQGQDYFGDVIKKTLKIETLKNQNEYRVSFLLFGEKGEKKKNIDFLLKKNAEGNLVIYSILNDNNLNFNDNLNYKQIENNIQGSWQTTCESPYGFSPLDEENTFVFTVMFNQIYIEAKIKKTGQNEYDMFLIKPNDLGRGGMGLSWEYFSKDKPIANIKLLDNNTLEFLWIGFYNKKSKEIEFDDCGLIMELETNPVILKRCDK